MAPPIVLVADGNEDSRFLFCEVLRHGGFEVHVADDGPDALARAATLRPDAIVLEVALPRIDGLDVMRRLKREPGTSHIRLIVATADARVEVREAAQDAACDAFLLKPCVPRELLRAVVELIGPAAAPTT